MTQFDDKLLDTLFHLAKIRSSEEERHELLQRLSNVLSYLDHLNEVDTSSVEPCYQVLAEEKKGLEEQDLPSPSTALDKEYLLFNAPHHTGGMIRIPPVIQSTE